VKDWKEGVKKAVIVDAAEMRKPPGTVVRFRPEEVTSRLRPSASLRARSRQASQRVSTRLSLHEGDLLGTLKLAELLGTAPEEVVLYGVQPGRMDPGMEFSPEVLRAVPKVVECVLEEVAAFESEGKLTFTAETAEIAEKDKEKGKRKKSPPIPFILYPLSFILLLLRTLR